jgi:D5 N terminal like
MKTRSTGIVDFAAGTGIRGIKHMADSSIKLFAEARFAIMSEPAIIANKPVVFDDHGMVPIKGFLIDPRTGELIPMTPEHYCTWHLGDIYDKNAKCPHWLQMLERLLSLPLVAPRSHQNRRVDIGH